MTGSVVIIETAATGFLVWGANPHGAQQPHLTRLAILEVDPTTGATLSEWCKLVRPPVRVSPPALEFWGITDADVARGIDPGEACHVLADYLSRAKRATSFSLEIHRKVCERTVQIQAINADWPEDRVCLMRAATNVVQKPQTQKKAGYAWPKLGEAHQFLFGAPVPRSDDMEEAGMEIARASARIYVELVRRGAIPPMAE